MTKKEQNRYKILAFSGKNFLFLCLSMGISGLLFLSTGCKNNDTTNPKLTITHPEDEITFRAGSDVLIEGTASDRVGLSTLSFSLQDPTGIFYQNQENELSGTEMDFQYVFRAVGDLQTETGSYTIKVTARDLSGNFLSVFLPVKINEIPRKHYKTFIGVTDGQGNTQLYLRDTLGTLTSQMPLGNAVSVFQMDNFQQQFLVANRLSGVFKSYHPDEFTQNWVVNSPTGSGGSTFTDLYRTKTDYYVGLGLSPFGEVYGVNGELFTVFSDIINPVNAIFFRQNRVITGETSVNAQVKRLAAYSLQSKELVSLNQLGWDITDIPPLNEVEMLVIGNDGAEGRIYVINGSTFAITEDYDLPTATIHHAALTPEYAFITTSTGVRRLDRENLSLTTIYAGEFGPVGYEPTRDQIYLGGTDEVQVISTSGSLIETITGFTGEVEFIDFHSNK